MFRKSLLALGVLLVPGLVAATARAESGKSGNIAGDAGPLELTLQASGANDRAFHNGGFNLGGSLGVFVTPNLEISGRDTVGYTDLGTGHSYSNTVQVAADLHFNFDRIQPFIGANAGYVTGTFIRATGEGAPEAGVKLFLNDTTFLYGMAQYQFFFNTGGTTFAHGQFLYALGLGVRF